MASWIVVLFYGLATLLLSYGAWTGRSIAYRIGLWFAYATIIATIAVLLTPLVFGGSFDNAWRT